MAVTDAMRDAIRSSRGGRFSWGPRNVERRRKRPKKRIRWRWSWFKENRKSEKVEFGCVVGWYKHDENDEKGHCWRLINCPFDLFPRGQMTPITRRRRWLWIWVGSGCRLFHILVCRSTSGQHRFLAVHRTFYTAV